MMPTEISQIAHQGRCFRRREAGFNERIRESGAQRADDGAWLGIDTGQALADRRLAIGPGNRDQRQVLAWKAIHLMCQRPRQGAQGRHGEISDGEVEFLPEIEIFVRLPENGDRPLGHRIRDVLTSVGQITRVGQEEIAWLHLAAIIRHPSRHDTKIGKTLQEFSRCTHSFPFPLLVSAVWTGASGLTPSVRSAPPMICENAGPATSPPKWPPAEGSSIITATTSRGSLIGATPTNEATYFFAYTPPSILYAVPVLPPTR